MLALPVLEETTRHYTWHYNYHASVYYVIQHECMNAHGNKLFSEQMI